MRTPLQVALRQTNAILNDKLRLLAAIPNNTTYTKTDPTHGASIGQHFRHSTFHIEKSLEPLKTNSPILNYDLRVRGDEVETDKEFAAQKINALRVSLCDFIDSANPPNGDASITVAFAMAEEGTSDTPFLSTIAREVAFGAHHAMHHLATMKVIAENVGGIKKGALGPDFGLAMSSRRHNSQQK